MKHDLSICAIFKNEGEYLREWIEFHRLVGVEHFYLYDNESTDGAGALLRPYVESGLVSYMTIGGELAQARAYMHCLKYHGDESAWIGFIDLDEFLFSPTGDDLKAVLAPFSYAPAVGVNWCVHGTGGHQTKPEGLVTESYRQRTRNADLNAHVKSIVRPASVLPIASPDPHHFIYADGLAVNERHQRFRGPFSEPVSFEILRINHYWTKSVEEARRKSTVPRADTGQRRELEGFLNPELNELRDDTIEPWVEKLRSALAR